MRIDERTCLKTAELIKAVHLRKSFYKRPFLQVSAPDEIRLRGYFYAVAICHQTYHLNHNELNLYGWDYLEHVFLRLMQEQDGLLQPGALAKMPVSILHDKLALLFSANGSMEASTLDRLDERAGMLVELDNFLEERFNGKLEKLITETKWKLVNQGKGFYEILPSLTAFADPMRKKITFLLKLLEEAGIMTILDPENVVPIMDYHMQRVLLRMGCVEIEDEDLHSSLENRFPLADDVQIRKTCIDAFSLIAANSNQPVTKLNDFFWSLGRSCCNEKPLCQVGKCEKEPCTFFEIVEIEEHATCFFKSCCKGFSDEKYRCLWQPMVETNYY